MIYLLLLGLVFGCKNGGADNPVFNKEEPAEMVKSPYEQWLNGPSADPSYFPLGVWLQDPKNAKAYQDIGINLYVGLWQGPTEAQLAALKLANMRVICAQNEVGLAHRDNPIIMAWMHGDEPDNAQPLPEGGWGGAVPPAEIIATYEQIKGRDPTRPVWLNLGQGVANDEWVGRAASYEDYPRYIEGTDIVSFDVYPVAGIRRDDGERFLWYVPKGVERLQQWANFSKPVWNVIETTRINSSKKATPQQVKAQVWMSLIHGSKGIVYFAHEWEPRFVEARLLEDEEMAQAVAAINNQVQLLAPVLNSGVVEGGVQVQSSQADIPIGSMVKRWRGETYLFAVPMRLGPVRGRFLLGGLQGRLSAEVLGEERSLAVVDGAFEDKFETYQVHLYRIGAVPSGE